MTPSDQKPPETRRRRLDDLFGDEPFLSNTMKARRLHEKMIEYPPMPEGAPVGVPASNPENRHSALLPDFIEEERPPLRILRAEPSEVSGRAAIRREVEPAVVEPPVTLLLSRESGIEETAGRLETTTRKNGVLEPETTEGSTLTGAAAYLRQATRTRQPESEQERLLRFRKDVLTQWLKDVPKREINRGREER